MIISYAAEAFGLVIHCVACFIQNFLDYNYSVVSCLVKVTNYLTDSSFDIAANVYSILTCYYHDFLTFLNELSTSLLFIVTIVIHFLSKGVDHIYATICYCLNIIQSLYMMIRITFTVSAQLLKQAMENFVYVITVIFNAVLLILQLGPNLFILLYESFIYGFIQASLYVHYNLFLILDYLYNFLMDCIYIFCTIPLKAYYGMLLLICVYYTYKKIKNSPIFTMFLMRMFSAFTNFILTILFIIVSNVKSVFVSVINTLLIKAYDRRSAYNYVQLSSLRQSNNKMHAAFERLKATFRTIRKNASSEFDVDQLQKELSVEKDRHSCIICHDRERNIILFPCRHMCMCEECTLLLQASYQDCPLCRTSILSTLHVYT